MIGAGMFKRTMFFITANLVLLFCSTSSLAGEKVQGTLMLGAGHLSSPLNISDDQAANYGSQSLQLAYPVVGSAGTMKFSYQGGAHH